ncbi:MAG: cell wall hydrolase [Lachnospiraceae bacterium]|nr:cell wall hydrolase [Lachnospiraceae bacterium]
MPAVSTNLHIRKGPGTSYKIIGKLPIMTYAFILEEDQNGWTKISTGNIEEGYVSSDYLFTQDEIISLCDREELVHATTTAGLNVRQGPGTYYEVMTKITKGKTYPVVLAESFDGWYAIRLNNGKIGYISANYVELTYEMDTGLTMKEIERLRDLADLESALNLEPGDGARVEANMLTSIKETKRDPISMTEDEIYLFATIIYTEAGNQQYEGKLAVANVILNRLEQGRYGNTLADVVFAEGQFSGAAPELIARAQARGIPDACFKAAREALAGRNNIGDFRFFRTTRSAYKAKDYATYTRFFILEDHVFYEKKWK